MTKFASATPALFCLVNLIYPISTRIAKSNGMETSPLCGNVWFPILTALAAIFACIWFCYSFNNAEHVNGLHSLFGVVSPTLAAVNGMCFMMADCGFLPCMFAIALWLSSLLVPAGCNDRRLGRHFRGILMLAPGACVLILALIFTVSCGLF